MKRYTIFFLLLFVGNIARSSPYKFYIALKSTDCGACIMGLNMALDDMQKLGVNIDSVYFLSDMVKKLAEKYVKSKFPRLKHVRIHANSDELLSRYSFYGSSYISVVDSCEQKQVFSCLAHEYPKHRTVFCNVLKNGFSYLVNKSKVKLDDSFASVNSFVVVDSTVLLSDSKMGSILKFSKNSGKNLGALSFDSSCYYKVYEHDPYMLQSITTNDTILDLYGLPKSKFVRVGKFNDSIFVSSLCHYAFYPQDNPKRFGIRPIPLLFLLDKNFETVKFGDLKIFSLPDKNYTLQKDFLFTGDDYEDVGIKIQDNKIYFSNNILYRYTRQPNTYDLCVDSHVQVDTPRFAKVEESCVGLYFYHLIKNENRRIIWYSYYAEYLDVESKKWVEIDPNFVGRIADRMLKGEEPFPFQVLYVYPLDRVECIVFRLKNDVYYALQANGNIYQCVKMFTKTERSEIVFSADSATSLYAVEFEPKIGDAMLYRFKIDSIFPDL